jgi:hypothetical protein
MLLQKVNCYAFVSPCVACSLSYIIDVKICDGITIPNCPSKVQHYVSVF